MLTIGELSKKTGMTIRTIRYYEEKGILKPDAYSNRGDRLFDEKHLDGIFFIKNLRDAGLSISEVQHYVHLLEQGRETIPERQKFLDEIEDKILQDIESKKQQLEHVRWKKKRYAEGYDY